MFGSGRKNRNSALPKDSFVKKNLPNKKHWPDLINLEKFSFPARLNCAAELLDNAVAEGYGDKIAIYSTSGNATYGDLLSQANQIANVLIEDFKIEPGSRVLIRSPNNVFMVACWFAVVKIGGVVVMASPIHRSKELSGMINIAQIKFALCDSRYANDLHRLDAQQLTNVLSFDGEGQLKERMSTKSKYFENYNTAADDVCQICFSTSADGLLNPTLHFHQDLLAASDAYAKGVLQLNENDLVIGTPSLALAYGLGALLVFPFRSRASTILMEQASLEDLLSFINSQRPTVLFNVPTAYRLMLDTIEKYDVSSLRLCVSAGEHLSWELWHLWYEKTGLELLDGIGTTELTHIFISSRPGKVKPGATGTCVAGYEAKIVDENGNELAVGKTGHLAVRGPTGCLYLNARKQNSYVRSGWNITGDAFCIDKDGYFWFKGRVDDLIIASGYNVSGSEIESMLKTQSAVADCGVVASPHKERGVVVKAFIVAAAKLDTTQQHDLAKTLQSWLKTRVAPYKSPRVFEFVDLLPKLENGELDRKLLRKRASIENPEGIDNCYYTPVWKICELVNTNSDNIKKQHTDQILLLGEPTSVGLLREKLDRHDVSLSGAIVITAVYAAAFQKKSPFKYEIRSGNEEDLSALMKELSSDNLAPQFVTQLHNQLRLEQLKADDSDELLLSASTETFSLAKAFMRRFRKGRFISFIQSTNINSQPIAQGLSGFYRTLNAENPHFNGRVVHISQNTENAPSKSSNVDNSAADILIAELLDNTLLSDVEYRDSTRFVREFSSVSEMSLLDCQDISPLTSEFRIGGTYLITGGLGALGLIIARYLLVRYQANVYLCGRSPVQQSKLAPLEELAKTSGARSEYIQCDVTDFASMRRAIEGINAQGNRLNGIIHSAGIIEDNFILKKSFEAFSRVISVKVKGTVILDAASVDQPLDFLVLFSSVAGIVGNPGQSDYGYGNAFEDYFSSYRNELTLSGDRKGKTVAINWPFWKNGGMTLTEQQEAALRKSFGIVPLGNREGLAALEFALSHPLAQIAVLDGDQTLIRKVLGVKHKFQQSESTVSPKRKTFDDKMASLPANTEKPMADKKSVVQLLIKVLSEELKLPEDEFHADGSFDNYGIDSAVMIEVITALEKLFPNLPKTLFFECQTLNKLAEFMMGRYQSELVSYIGVPLGNAARLSTAVIPNSDRQVNQQELHKDWNAREVVNEDIAIIGISGRYPGADNLNEFWRNIEEGRDCVGPIPSERGWEKHPLFKTVSFNEGLLAQTRAHQRWGSFLDHIDQFDPLFFNIAPKEAEEMDPHERLFLEAAFLAIADSGYRPDQLTSVNNDAHYPVGVYAGLMWGDYHLPGPSVDQPAETGIPHSFYWAVANRVSHQFNFSGPSITIDTACSSSLTAIHLAMQAIKNGEIEVALAGAVNLSLHPAKYALLSHLHFMSSDGRCRSFGSGGDGYVPSEGVGAVVLKSVNLAQRDGDHIYGVIRGSSINHGGKTSGFTVPNPNRQASLIKSALVNAGVQSKDVSYIEAHGTGTSLGDPIEVAGLSQAFSQNERLSCALGSVKSNMGHAEAAAGVAGLSKILLQMRHKKIAPSLHSQELNPYAYIENSPFFVPQRLSDWVPANNGKRVAALSSFGAGGANGHLIIEEPDDLMRDRAVRSPQTQACLILLSARKEKSLRALVSELYDFLDAEPGVDLRDLAYTLQLGRLHMDYGFAAIASDLADLQQQLNAYLNDSPSLKSYYGKRERNSITDSIVPSGEGLGDLALAWMKGHKIVWAKLYKPGEAFRISAPAYVFDRQSYWINLPQQGFSEVSLDTLLDRNVSTLDEQCYEKTFQPNDFYVRDHRLGQSAVIPGVVYLEMALQAAQHACGSRSIVGISDICWNKAAVIGERPETLRLGLYPSSNGVEFDVFQDSQSQTETQNLENPAPINQALSNQSPNTRVLYATGNLLLADSTANGDTALNGHSVEQIDIPAIQSRCQIMESREVNACFGKMGLSMGPSFQLVQRIFYNDSEVLSFISSGDDLVLPEQGSYQLHPAILDNIIRSALGVKGFKRDDDTLVVPVSVAKMEIYRPVTLPVWSYARIDEHSDARSDKTVYSISAVDQSGIPLLSFSEFTVQRVARLAAPIAKSPTSPSLTKKSTGVVENTQQDESGGDNHLKRFLTQLLARVTKIPESEIDSSENLNNYGIDSVMIMTMNESIEGKLAESIPKTLFYEYGSVEELVVFFKESYPEAIAKHFSGVETDNIRRAKGIVENENNANSKQAVEEGIQNNIDLISEIPYTAQPTAVRRTSRFTTNAAKNVDYAIVGLAGRYPGAESLDEFWNNLANGVDCVSEVPIDRWDWRKDFTEDRHTKGGLYNKWGGFLNGIDQFDPEFFRIAPRDAVKMDPQERLFLQTAWESVQDAAYTADDMKTANVGVFVGVMWGLYEHCVVSSEQLRYGKPSSSHSSVANRVSYALNLNGPSVALDTMCSSSLTAIHQACLSIAAGDCQLAIAGGVNISTHKLKYELLCQEQFLSSDGRCRTFGEGGDGYVPGEGVGALLIKSLPQAIADGDNIYAVIKGSAVNHGGRTSGYTVPNQNAQTSVISKALSRAGWKPDSLSYIEAHGTGTSLGDPIEIAGLTKAFKTTGDRALPESFRCSIGSVKSNIGHLESAAGIAGITKVLLQFKHKKIAPSLHSKSLNTNIDFKSSPFSVPQSLMDWPLPNDRTIGVQHSRRAGVSSFGAGGANAHILLEQYSEPEINTEVAEIPVIFLLSADTENRLQRYCESVLAFVKHEMTGDARKNRILLHRLAYTSQVGREALRQRIAIVTSNLQTLVDALVHFLQGGENDLEYKDVLFYSATNNSDNKQSTALNSIFGDDAKKLLISTIVENKQWHRLANMWVLSVDIEWGELKSALYPQVELLGRDYLHKMSFPALPFITQSYWIEQDKDTDSGEPLASLHPLIDANVSTLSEQLYQKRFFGTEYYLDDHRVNTGKSRVILPGVAYLEMARVCGDQAMGGLLSVRKIRNLLWQKPIEIGSSPEDVTVRLTQCDTYVEFEMLGNRSTDEVYAQGEILFTADEDIEDDWLDIEAIKKAAVSSESKADIYKHFRRMGFEYGPSYQVTHTRYHLNGAALSLLELPVHLRRDYDSFVMHPCVMDAAIRTGLAVNVDDNGEQSTVPVVPFALEEVEIRSSLPERCYSYATRSDNENNQDGKLTRYNIFITDEAGRVLIKFRNFLARELTASEPEFPAVGLYKYNWIASPLHTANLPDWITTVLVVSENTNFVEACKLNFPSSVKLITPHLTENAEAFTPEQAASWANLFERLANEKVLPDAILFQACAFPSSAENLDVTSCISLSINALMHMFQAYEHISPNRRYRCIYAFPESSDVTEPFNCSISGFAKSLLGVNHRLELQTLVYDATMSKDSLASAVISELSVTENISGREIRYISGSTQFQNTASQVERNREERRLALKEDIREDAEFPALKQGGTYLITGGLGKLGLLFAKHLVENYQANLVLVGRSEPTVSTLAEMESLRNNGVKVIYQCADITDRIQVKNVIKKSLETYGSLTGVLHSAGLADAKNILEHNLESFNQILAGKVIGSVILDEETRDLALDFFMMFSSVSALIGDLGSGSYACANRFMDDFAVWRQQQVKAGLRQGLSISVNWPLWLGGGMDLPEEEQAFFNFSGIRPLTYKQGLVAFERILNTGLSQVLVAGGDRVKMSRYLKIQDSGESEQAAPAEQRKPSRKETKILPLPSEIKTASPPKIVANSSGVNLKSESGIKTPVLLYLREKLSETIKKSETELNNDARFESYGMDSVMLMEMHNSLKTDFEGLSKTVLFEYDTLNCLADHLIEHYADFLTKKYQTNLSSVTAAVSTPPLNTSVNHVTPMPSITSPLRDVGSAKLMAPLKRKTNNAQVSRKADDRDQDIAVIGLSGRFPGSKTLADFWRNVVSGVDVIETIPADRWNADDYFEPGAMASNKVDSKWGGFIENSDLFDHGFFNMAFEEAVRLDPQVKITLETAWHAFEDAGYSPKTLSDKVGVYIGAMSDDFTRVTNEIYRDTGVYMGPGHFASDIANRLSLCLDLCGPSFTVQATCASSLTALHLARTAIANGECEMALAGGVNLSLHPNKYLLLQQMKVLSPTGKEHTFDENANGLVPSEGIGLVVLKSYTRALADGDNIYGVIKSSVQSHTGAGAGPFLPNIRTMQDTIKTAIESSGIEAQDIHYVECHGTGTELGDPIELKALQNAFSRVTDQKQFCALGSKANLGHMEAASGVCSLIKVLYAMKQRTLAPCCNLNTINASFDSENSHFEFVREPKIWNANKNGSLAAGINSFGIGGSNVFMVVESGPAVMTTAPVLTDQSPQVILLSARSKAQLRSQVENYIEYFNEEKYAGFRSNNLADIAYTTQIGRSVYAYRLAIVASGLPEFLNKAQAWLEKGTDVIPGIYSGCIREKHSKLIADLFADDNGLSLTESLLTSGVIEKLATVWTCGGSVDWQRFYETNNGDRNSSSHKPRRISLPGYPFEKIDTGIYRSSALSKGNKKSDEVAAIKSQAKYDKTAKNSTAEIKDGFVYTSGAWFESDRDNLDASKLIDSYGCEEIKSLYLEGGNWKAHYYHTLINELSDDLFNTEESVEESSQNTSFIRKHSVNYEFKERQVANLQGFTQEHWIELSTLVIGAWALLVGRLSNQTQVTFAYIDDDIHPCQLNTVGRQGAKDWLRSLQNSRLLNFLASDEKHAANNFSACRWETVVHLVNENSHAAQANIPAPICLHLERTSTNIYLKLESTDTAVFGISLETFCEHLLSFIEGIIQNPRRNPSMLSLLTKTEYRERFWQRLEQDEKVAE